MKIFLLSIVIFLFAIVMAIFRYVYIGVKNTDASNWKPTECKGCGCTPCCGPYG